MAYGDVIRRAIALLLIVGGLWLATFPFVSQWRVSGEVLEMLPEATVSAPDDRRALALFDGEFVLATRTYRDTTPAEVESSLRRAGFEPQYQRDGHRWFWRTCCGSYDAALVRIDTTSSDDEAISGQRTGQVEGNTVRVIATVFDDDSQAVWAMFAVVGSALVVFGVLVGRWPRTRVSEADHDDPVLVT